MKIALKLMTLFIALYTAFALIWYIAFDLVGLSNKFVAPYIYMILYLPFAILVILLIKALISKASLKSIGVYIFVGIILVFATSISHRIMIDSFGPAPSLDSM